jgi:hypothetical protein
MPNPAAPASFAPVTAGAVVTRALSGTDEKNSLTGIGSELVNPAEDLSNRECGERLDGPNLTWVIELAGTFFYQGAFAYQIVVSLDRLV